MEFHWRSRVACCSHAFLSQVFVPTLGVERNIRARHGVGTQINLPTLEVCSQGEQSQGQDVSRTQMPSTYWGTTEKEPRSWACVTQR